MDSKEYQALALVTESKNYGEIERVSQEKLVRLLHGGIGVATEGGEILDALKKHIFYGKPLDEVNLKEEVGDLLWYIAIICDELNTSFDEIMSTNIEKLRARYGGKFSEVKALNRNLQTERAILEK